MRLMGNGVDFARYWLLVSTAVRDYFYCSVCLCVDASTPTAYYVPARLVVLFEGGKRW